jgi:radical SAM superfamily enzyme YgiQ (UPF0313 family)
MAPEVATDRLRAIIRKPISNEDLIKGCSAAWKAGYRLLKFYFMMGLPAETEDDLRAIVSLCEEASKTRTVTYRRCGRINVAVSSHVPKPHTPFQWEPMNTREELFRKQRLVRSFNKSSYLNIKFHDVNESYLEAVFSRGDRRLAAALLAARQRGLRMDAWSECFDMPAWEDVFAETKIDADQYAYRKRKTDEILPWDVVTIGSPTHYLLKERERAYAAMG